MDTRKASRAEEILLIVSSLLLLLSTLYLAHTMGTFSGPTGIIGPPAVYENSKYTLAFMDDMEADVDKERLIADLDRAFASVEKDFKHTFGQKIRIVVRRDLISEFALGTTSNLPWKLVIQLAKDGMDISTYRHEITHAMIADRGLDPPYAINEGMAYFYEDARGWDAGFMMILMDDGVADNYDRPIGNDMDPAFRALNRRSLATGWMTVYYLAKVKGMPLDEIVALKNFPDPHQAFDELLEHLRNPRRN